MLNLSVDTAADSRRYYSNYTVRLVNWTQKMYFNSSNDLLSKPTLKLFSKHHTNIPNPNYDHFIPEYYTRQQNTPSSITTKFKLKPYRQCWIKAKVHVNGPSES